jgi:two-component system, sensor histidine kinase PdtaS
LDTIVNQCPDLTSDDVGFLGRIERQLGIMADLSRGDGLLYGRLSRQQAVVLAHAQPHSIAPAYLRGLQGAVVDPAEAPLVLRTITSGRLSSGSQGDVADGAAVIKRVLPVYSPGDKRTIIGALSVDTLPLEFERHRRRSTVFQRALIQLQLAVQHGLLAGVADLTPSGEHEGIVITDREGVIRYASSIATNLYRRLGYVESLMARHLETLETADYSLATWAVHNRRCTEQETEEGGRVWVRKALPLFDQPAWRRGLSRYVAIRPAPLKLAGALLVIRDATETRLQEQELRVKSAMIQEIHHRVKNNLQTIAALLRIQARRVETGEARLALDEATSRILSVAVIHEFLSQETTHQINFRDVSQRILSQHQDSTLSPDKEIRLELEGPPVLLPARQATAAALVINELVQNAMEHGFESRKSGTISVRLEDDGDHVIVSVRDDGGGLPSGFDLALGRSLGLQIVQTLAREDLKGKFELREDGGTCALVTFPKATFGGEEGWNEPG